MTKIERAQEVADRLGGVVGGRGPDLVEITRRDLVALFDGINAAAVQNHGDTTISLTIADLMGLFDEIRGLSGKVRQ